jgi:hypothetical protein
VELTLTQESKEDQDVIASDLLFKKCLQKIGILCFNIKQVAISFISFENKLRILKEKVIPAIH